MTILKITLLAVATLLIAAVLLGLWVHSRDQAQAGRVWAVLEATREADPPRYDPTMTAELPEVAQRHFARAIEPGTPLHRMVRLEMEGSFILNGNPLPMTARQILTPPAQGFVWQAEIGAGVMHFAGSDGYHRTLGAEESWTKFWLRGLIPLARIGGTDDHARAAATQVMLDHPAYVGMMQMLDAYGGGMNVPVWWLAVLLIRAPEYSLHDLQRWLDGANRGSGPMWPDYSARDLMAEVPVMPVPMLLISGAADLNTPVELAAEWFDAVEAPQGKRHIVLETSGHAPFLTEPDRFSETVRGFASTLRRE